MGRTITVPVINNRVLFRCPACRARRNMAMLQSLRQKVIGCHQCQVKTKCILNRRTRPRESQAGKVVIITSDNKETEVNLHDISMDGAGFDLPYGLQKTFRLSVGSQIRFRCSWNPRLFGSSYYEVRTIIGQRVGVRKM